MSRVFDFRPGLAVKNLTPAAIGQELARIREQRGALTPLAVVEAARAKKNPLHAAFEWDDSAAAHQYRLTQARRLIVSVRVIEPEQEANVPAFVSVRVPDTGRQYLPTVEALSDEQLRARVLQEVRQFIESVERRYRHFAELAGLLAGLREVAA